MKLHELFEIMDPNRPGKRGLQGYTEPDEDEAAVSNYGPRDAKKWLADAEQMGLIIKRIGQGTFQALVPGGGITGEFNQRYGGMIAYNRPPVA